MINIIHTLDETVPLSQKFTQTRATAQNVRFDGPQRHAEYFGRFRMTELASEAQHDRGTLIGRKLRQRLAERETIVFQAGTHTETIRMRYADYARLVQPTVIAFARDYDLGFTLLSDADGAVSRTYAGAPWTPSSTSPTSGRSSTRR